ncbi:MAG TPA: DUF3604 domain-containing protein [Bradyrhizobium sp.]
MLGFSYLPEHMGTATLEPAGPFVAGSHAALVLTYTAGKFGIDDSGDLKIVWRGTSDMGKPQFTEPAAANYTTVEASNGAVLQCRVDRNFTRPWVNALSIRVGRGFLRSGETITIRLGDTRQGSPGLRLQTNVEPTFEFKVLVDAFATYQFTELPRSPEIALVAGPAARWKALAPSQNIVGEPFRLCIVAEDRWGNPTATGVGPLKFKTTSPIGGLPDAALTPREDGTFIVEGLVARAPGDVGIEILDERGQLLCRSTPLRVVASSPYRHYWGDLHAQSEETIGTNSAADYFAYARDKAFVDIVGHQGNDFQITDAFWKSLNELTRQFNVPGRFVALPGYEWSGNTGMGGDRNIFYRAEGRPIRRSSRILVTDPSSEDCYTADELFQALDRSNEDAIVIAHVGGRYADINLAHDGRFERAVEIHSTWGTFEWLLHDAFDRGYRVGIVCHSDDHKGRPGATQPGASTFGAIGGLTCYLMAKLDRDAVFDALRQRRHYGTTGTRLFMSVKGTFDQPVAQYDDDPLLGATSSQPSTEVPMGAIVANGGVPMQLSADVIGSSPIDRVDIFHGKTLIRTVRPFSKDDLGKRIRVMWSGAEYRGRGREVNWRGKASMLGNRIERAEAVNFLNPDKPLGHDRDSGIVSWNSVTTGNMAGFDLWLEAGRAGVLSIETNIVSAKCDLAALDDGEIVFEGGGLGRQLRVYRLPESRKVTSMHVTHQVTEIAQAGADVPVYVRVTQEDGHQAWSSPIYLIKAP